MHFWLDYGGIVMSKENPGVIFDASNSWNGYNHQGSSMCGRQEKIKTEFVKGTNLV